MNENNNTTCQHTNRMVTGGVVRCTDCHEFFPEHPDSDPRPGMVESNQFR
jgi:hypothetical protein